MVKKRKLFEKLINSPTNIMFDDFVTLLIAFGFSLERIRGSHHIFSHPKVQVLLPIQPHEGGKAKPYQIRQFLRLVEEYSLTLSDNESDQS